MNTQTIRNLIPRRLKALYAESVSKLARVSHRSDLTNIYHCCVHKTGSQWIRKILSDRRTFMYTGLRPYHYQSRLKNGDRRDIKDRTFVEPFPRRTIVSPIYINYEHFHKMPKPERHKAFFIWRDPRDVLVSWYFSTKISHPNKQSDVHRDHLRSVSESDGLAYGIDLLKSRGLFDALSSWQAANDPHVIVVRYEDLVGESAPGEFRRLFNHLEIPFPDEILAQLLDDYSFKKLSGRKQGEEDTSSKFRKGIAGDWKNHFDGGLSRKFAEAIGQ